MVGAELVSGPSWSVGRVGQWAELTSFRCIDCIPCKLYSGNLCANICSAFGDLKPMSENV